MADTDIYEMTPEERTKYRRQALDSFGNVSVAKDNSLEAGKRAQMLSGGEALFRAQRYGTAPVSNIQGQIASQIGESMPKMRAEQDALAQQGAQQEQGIIGATQTAQLGKFQQNMLLKQEDAARQVAKRAFDLGMESKELTFHNNVQVADMAFEQLTSDYEAGRVNAKEITQLQQEFQKQQQEFSNQASQLMALIEGNFNTEQTEASIEVTKANIIKMLEYQKKAAIAAAKGANTAAILGGVVKLGTAAFLA